MTEATQFWNADQIKEFIESILVEKDRALTMAGDEREKAASALRNEQQRALDQADRERDRAAEKLRAELARQIDEGDDRLREHIAQQFQQINAALFSSEKLEVERLSRLQAVVDALGEKLEVLRVAQQLAQSKFEASVESRFAQVNEFRGSLDDLGKTMATRRELEQAMLGATAKIDELNKLITEMRSRLDVGPSALKELQVRADLGQGRGEGKQQNMAAVYALAGVALTIIGLVAAVYLGTH